MNLRTTLNAIGALALSALALAAGTEQARATLPLPPLQRPTILLPPHGTADLALSAGVSTQAISVGETVTYTLTVKNNGPHSAAGVVASGTLSSRLTSVLVSSSSPAGRRLCGLAEPISCTVGTLASGETASVRIVAKAVAGGLASNRFVASAATVDRNKFNNGIDVQTEVRSVEAPPADTPADPAPTPDPTPPGSQTPPQPPIDTTPPMEPLPPFQTLPPLPAFGDSPPPFSEPQPSFGRPLPGEPTLDEPASNVGDGHGKPPKAQPPALQTSRCTIFGGPQADVLRGTGGKDVICGRGGNDVLIGLGGADVLRGGSGKDRLVGGKGKDCLLGGAGNDTLVARDRLGDVVNGGQGTDQARVDRKLDRLQAVESAR